MLNVRVAAKVGLVWAACLACTGYCELVCGQDPVNSTERENPTAEIDPAEIDPAEIDPAEIDPAVFQSRWMRHSAKGPSRVPERDWVLRDGTRLRGLIHVPREGRINVIRERFPGPGQRLVTIPLDEFTDDDQTIIPAGLRTVPAPNRRFSLYQGFAVSPQWQSAQPEFPKRYDQVISMEGDEVFFSSGFNLIAVHKSYFTQQFLDEVSSGLAEMGHQLVLDIGIAALSVAGEPQGEVGDAFVMRVRAPYKQERVELAVGLSYLLPKHLLSAEIVEQVRLVIKKVQAAGVPASDSLDGASDFPRLCLTRSGAAMIDVPKEPGFESVVGSSLTGEPKKMRPIDLRCVDQWWWEVLNLPTDTQSTDAKRELHALAQLLDSVDKRNYWSQYSDHAHFNGILIGRLADGFLFQAGSHHFVVPASQLATIDARILTLAAKTRLPDWSTKSELRDVCANRVVGFSFVRVGSKLIELDGALVGAYPQLTYLAGSPGKERPLDDYTSLSAARTVFQWLQANQEILSVGDNAQVAAALNAKYSLPAIPDVDLDSLPPDRNVHTWRLARNDANPFQAILAGHYEQDLVFETEVDGQTKYYLVPPAALSPESRLAAEQLLPRTEPQDWQQLLTRADNWQYYRIWVDPSQRVRTPTEPSVVESISNSLIRFRPLDGHTSSQPMPRDEEERREYFAFYEPAMTAAIQARERAEASLALWTFQDCEPILRAELIGDAGGSFVVRDANRIEFLVNKSCLTEASLRDLLYLQRTTDNLKTIDPVAVWEMPRVWCTRTKLIGPATPEYLTNDAEQLVMRMHDGREEVLRMSDLTLREQLSFIKDWQLQHGQVDAPPELATADSMEALESWLAQPIAQQDILQDCPALAADIKREVVAAFASWTHDTWPAVEIPLPSDKPLLAVNADATAGIVATGSQWQVIDFASGKVGHLPSAVAASGDASASHRLGPWMGSDNRQAYWVEEGVLMRGVVNDSLAQTRPLSDEIPKIVAACQTSSWEYLVFLCEDSSVRRWRIPEGPVEVIAPNLARPEATNISGNLWASLDGEAVVWNSGSTTSFRVKANSSTPELGGFLGSVKPIEFAVVGRDSAWLGMNPGDRQLTRLKGATNYMRPTHQSFPFLPSWVGAVKVDGQEVLQAIGRTEDQAAKASDINYVLYTGTNGYLEQFATQHIIGQIDDRARVAANGAAVVHWRGPQAVVSRRPAALVLDPPLQLTAIIHRIVAQGNIGQLEALARFLEQPPYNHFGASAGWLNIRFHELVKSALFQYQPHLGGDRLGRALQLADRFRLQYPRSQVAATALADIERDLAWSARGGGYAGSVTEAGREAFHTHMQSASGLLEPFVEDDALAGTLRALIDVAMATGRMDLAGQVAQQLETGEHAKNRDLHHALAFMLLPRWHGSPGSSEAYRDKVAKQLGGAAGEIMYAELVLRMLSTHGTDAPLSTRMTIDLQRVLDGTLAYYETGIDASLIDSAILLMTLEGENEWVTQLLKLKSDKQLLPSATAATSWQSFQSIEQNLGK